MIKRNREGFTLIELVVTILIFAVGITGIMKLHSEVVRTNAYSMQLTHAVNSAQSQMEFLRGLSFAHDSMMTGAHTTSSIVSSQGITYSLSWDVDDPGTTPSSRSVFVNVRWQDKDSGHAIHMDSIWDELQ